MMKNFSLAIKIVSMQFLGLLKIFCSCEYTFAHKMKRKMPWVLSNMALWLTTSHLKHRNDVILNDGRSLRVYQKTHCVVAPVNTCHFLCCWLSCMRAEMYSIRYVYTRRRALKVLRFVRFASSVLSIVERADITHLSCYLQLTCSKQRAQRYR